MKNRRITLHVFLVLLTAALAVVWTTRSHASSHPIIASLDESPMVVYGDEQPNNTGVRTRSNQAAQAHGTGFMER
jgi:hypothetical protein